MAKSRSRSELIIVKKSKLLRLYQDMTVFFELDLSVPSIFPLPTWLTFYMNGVLDVVLSCEHDEHFRNGRLKANLPTDHDQTSAFRNEKWQ